MCVDERDDQVGTDSFKLETAISRFGVVNGESAELHVDLCTSSSEDSDLDENLIIEKTQIGHPLCANTDVMNGDITQQVPKQQQHKHNNFQSKQRQPVEQTGEKERERGNRAEREKGRGAEKERDKEVKKDVTGWTVVTRSKKQRKRTIQIFVKVDGSKVNRWR